jgi:hypothetical protein
MMLPLFCLSLAKTEACCKGKKEGGEIGSNNHMSTPKEIPQNIDPNSLTRRTEMREPGWGVKKPEEPKQQPSDPNREAFERFFRRGPMKPAVFEGIPPRRQNVEGNQPTPQKPSEQRGEPEASKPNPAEQQAAERLGKPPPEKAGSDERPEHDPQLRRLAQELSGHRSEEVVSNFIELALDEPVPKLVKMV